MRQNKQRRRHQREHQHQRLQHNRWRRHGKHQRHRRRNDQAQQYLHQRFTMMVHTVTGSDEMLRQHWTGLTRSLSISRQTECDGQSE